jgi:hypothetical protein
VVVVLPTPPFWLATAMTLHFDCINIKISFPHCLNGYVRKEIFTRYDSAPNLNL